MYLAIYRYIVHFFIVVIMLCEVHVSAGTVIATTHRQVLLGGCIHFRSTVSDQRSCVSQDVGSRQGAEDLGWRNKAVNESMTYLNNIDKIQMQYRSSLKESYLRSTIFLTQMNFLWRVNYYQQMMGV